MVVQLTLITSVEDTASMRGNTGFQSILFSQPLFKSGNWYVLYIRTHNYTYMLLIDRTGDGSSYCY